LNLNKAKLGEVVQAKGTFSFPNEKVAFSAFSIVVEMKGRKPVIANYITTVPIESNQMTNVESIEEPADKEGKEKQSQKAIFSKHSVVSQYNQHGGYIDAINAQLLECKPLFRNPRWKVKLKILNLTSRWQCFKLLFMQSLIMLDD
jgi:hypothetical protein